MPIPPTSRLFSVQVEGDAAAPLVRAAAGIAIYGWGDPAGFDRWFPKLKAAVEAEAKLPPKTRLVWKREPAGLTGLLTGR